MKKSITNYLMLSLLLGGLLSISGCSSDETEYATDKVKISIKSDLIDLQTRASSNSQNTQFAAGQKVGAYVYDYTLDDALYTNAEITALGTPDAGKFAYNPTMYYPSNNNTVSILAYHPFSATGVDEDGNIEYTLPADQTTESAYLNSDVIYGSVTNKRQTSEIPVQFKHKLSKIAFTIKKGEGADIDALSKIEILGVLPKIKLNVPAGTITTAEGTASDFQAFNVSGGTDATELAGSAVIVPPQAFTAGTKLFKITIGSMVYTFTPSETVTFVGGNCYSYVITVKMGKIEVNSQITDWNTGALIEVDGDMDV